MLRLGFFPPEGWRRGGTDGPSWRVGRGVPVSKGRRSGQHGMVTECLRIYLYDKSENECLSFLQRPRSAGPEALRPSLTSRCRHLHASISRPQAGCERLCLRTRQSMNSPTPVLKSQLNRPIIPSLRTVTMYIECRKKIGGKKTPSLMQQIILSLHQCLYKNNPVQRHTPPLPRAAPSSIALLI